MPVVFKLAYGAGLLVAVAAACLTLLIPTDSGVARFFLLLGGLAVGAAIYGMAGAVIGLCARPPVKR